MEINQTQDQCRSIHGEKVMKILSHQINAHNYQVKNNQNSNRLFISYLSTRSDNTKKTR